MTATPEPPSLDDGQAADAARTILVHHLGEEPKSLTPLGGGLTNFVFEADHAQGNFVIRLSPEPGKVKDYLKEQWAMGRAAEVGVPVPEVLEVGADPVSYMISRKVAGIDAGDHQERMAILRAMGRLTALIHTIPTSGFGQTFDWSSNQLSRKETWADYLRRELRLNQRLDVLERHDMLSPAQRGSLRRILRDIEGWDPATVLNHGDMRLKNVLVDDAGRITTVMDWEHCSSNIAPYWDLSLALHDLSIDDKQAFLGGYGLSETDIRTIGPVLKALNVINYAPYVERAAEEGDQRRLDQYRTRFSGALDLYSV